MNIAAIYARVSSDKQKEEQTIGSQVAALKEYAGMHGHTVPPEWIFLDEGYSGATLQRPGLEQLRDVAAEGRIDKVLVYSPDRLSRKYAYQVLLIEEFARYGVEVVFIKSPQATTPEEQLLVQFQGMIAEYERAQIAERSRRGKKYRAKAGSINVLSGAPYGYRYIRKTDTSAAYYEIEEIEASTVRKIFDLYTKDFLSIGAIAKKITSEGIPTKTGKFVWDRSVIWAMLKNPAYKGTACYGKTEVAQRKKATRLSRKRGGFSPRCSSTKERPMKDWIEIPVAAIISEETFDIAQERLQKNKALSKRRTIEPTLLQGVLVCRLCGYAYYRTSTRTSKRKIYYYRCLGSDDYRYTNGRVCESQPIRQDYLDELVWQEIVKLLENPDIIRNEIDKRIKEAQALNPSRKRKETLNKELGRVRKGIGRLIDAYQDDLLDLSELRQRSSALRKRESTLKSELASLEATIIEEGAYLRLTNKIDDFLKQLCYSAENMTVLDRQKVVRLIVKEILIDKDTVTIKHSIPVKNPPVESNGQFNGNGGFGRVKKSEIIPSYLLCRRSNKSFVGEYLSEQNRP